MERAVKFVNRAGLEMFGILHEPDGSTRPAHRTGILIPVSAIKPRGGSFRLHTLLARQLARDGYFVLCFDPAGVGDSEGEFEHKLLMSHYLDIQNGRYDQDLSDASQFFRAECSLAHLLQLGLCGGAISALINAGHAGDVDGLILLGLPVFREDVQRFGRGVDNAAKITSPEKALDVLGPKLRKLLSADFWWRLVTLRVDLAEEARLVARSAGILARNALRPRRSAADAGRLTSRSTPLSNHPRYNPLFQGALTRFLERRGQALLVFGALDHATSIFRSEFLDPAGDRLEPYASQFTVKVIEGANHIFSAGDSQAALFSQVSAWLRERYPA